MRTEFKRSAVENWKRDAASGATGAALMDLWAVEDRRRLVLEDDDMAMTLCEDQFQEFYACKDTNDDDPGDDRRRLQSRNQILCSDLLELQKTSANPCHDGIFDDGDANCESELFAAYSCFFTVVCEEEFICEDFDPGQIYDTDVTAVNGSKMLTFYNSYPSLDYKVCYFFGPSWGTRHERTAGPLSYGEVSHLRFEGERIYMNVHSVAPTASDCSDPSRRRMTFATYVTSTFETPANFIGWGPDRNGVGAPDLWRSVAESGDIDDKIFVNEAVNFGNCAFTWIQNGLIPDPVNGMAFGTDVGAMLALPSYDGIHSLQVTCSDNIDEQSAVLDIDTSLFCEGGAQHFLAVGDDTKSLFPLQIMLIQGVPCNGVDLDEVEPPQIIIGEVTSTSPPEQERVVVTVTETETKKSTSNSSRVLLAVVIALAVCIFCCVGLVLFLMSLVAKARPGAWSQKSSTTTPDLDDDVVTIQLPEMPPEKNPVHNDQPPTPNNNPIHNDPRAAAL